MMVSINWQDDDSSTSRAIKETYRDAEIILCRGHEGRSHLNQLKNLMSMKRFNNKTLKAHHKHIAGLSNETCWCKKFHR